MGPLFPGLVKSFCFCRYLYFDIQRAVELIGGKALAEANNAVPNLTLADYSASKDKVPFCLGLPSTGWLNFVNSFWLRIHYSLDNPVRCSVFFFSIFGP